MIREAGFGCGWVGWKGYVHTRVCGIGASWKRGFGVLDAEFSGSAIGGFGFACPLE